MLDPPKHFSNVKLFPETGCPLQAGCSRSVQQNQRLLRRQAVMIQSRPCRAAPLLKDATGDGPLLHALKQYDRCDAAVRTARAHPR